MSSTLKDIPYFGVGIGLRLDIAEETIQNNKEIQVVEIIAEHYFSDRPKSAEFLERAQNAFPIVPHGIKLSIGNVVPIDYKYLDEVKTLTTKLKSPYYSDHFTLAGHDDLLDIGHLSPLWYTKEALERLVERIDTVQQYIGIPLILENITAPFIIPETDYEEPEFITEICRRTGCGLLLDVTNVHINAFNFKKDAQKLIERYPMDSVVHMHLAGGELHDGYYYDTHSKTLDGVNEAVWPLFEWAVKNSDVKTVIIERDDDFGNDFEQALLKDLRHARAIVDSARSNQ